MIEVCILCDYFMNFEYDDWDDYLHEMRFIIVTIDI